MSTSTENFIKTIYQCGQRQGYDTRPGTIAGKLGVSNAAATDMARKLAAKKLVVYEKYRQLTLTEQGRKMALEVIRKHRLWETFLHEVLGLTLHEIHREAELLEHQTSDFLANRISEFLGHPVVDPHGDPIPTKEGVDTGPSAAVNLSEAIAGKRYIIARLLAADHEFFDFCSASDLLIGSELWVKKKYKEMGLTEVVVNQKDLLLNGTVAGGIFVVDAVDDTTVAERKVKTTDPNKTKKKPL